MALVEPNEDYIYKIKLPKEQLLLLVHSYVELLSSGFIVSTFENYSTQLKWPLNSAASNPCKYFRPLLSTFPHVQDITVNYDPENWLKTNAQKRSTLKRLLTNNF